AKFLRFFDEAGIPVYDDYDDETPEEERPRNYICASPAEQHMIRTGKRLFKGYDDYDELLRMQWDLETEGLDPKTCAISQIGVRTNRGFEKIIPVEGEGNEKRENEIKAIDIFFQTIRKIQPDVISGHNTENFDWNFIDQRLKMAGVTMKNFTKDLFYGEGVYKKKTERVLKLGGDVEYYFPTVMWGHNLTDSLFAVRRAQALDSDMKRADLKYITKYSKIAKKNRVYVPGKIINDTWVDTEKRYAFNNENGRWMKVDEDLLRKTFVDEKGENVARYGYESDGTLVDNSNGERFEMVSGRYVVERYLLDDLWETDKVEHMYNLTNFLVTKMVPIPFEKVTTGGTAAVWRSIMCAWSFEQGLAIPAIVQQKSFTGGLSRLLRVGYVDRIVKLDYNSLYPSIMLSFNYKTPIDVQGALLTMLDYVLSKREYYKGEKKTEGKKANALSEQIEELRKNGALPTEIEQLEDEMKEHKTKSAGAGLAERPLKVIGNGAFGSFGSGGPFPWTDFDVAEAITCTGRQMLRLMIGHFTEKKGYLPVVGDTDGFNFQSPKEFEYTEDHPYVSVGGGRNTVKGKSYTGVEADVAEFEDLFLHTPFNGGIKKFGLGIDCVCQSTANYARKCYSDLMDDGEVVMIGNTIKSKKMPLYIERFINEALPLLLYNKGKEFLDAYYNHIERIYNMRIPLREIASVGKIKTSLKEYRERCKGVTKGGTKNSRQAWYELAIKDNLDVHMGDAIYYINTGSKKTDSDVQRLTRYYTLNANGTKNEFWTDKEGNVVVDRKGNPVTLAKHIDTAYKDYIKKGGVKYKSTLDFARKELRIPNLQEEDYVVFNCVRLPNEIVDNEEETFCDDGFAYNVDKYIHMFNSRIKLLFVCFDRSIRGDDAKDIIITNPKDRKYFTEEECQLVSGQPFHEEDQDTYEQLMTMEDKEIRFWIRVGKVPPFVEECGMDWGLIKGDYISRNGVQSGDDEQPVEAEEVKE
ncbi:MAG: ribonuclease H-like domain-containing protein, partial [Bacteroidales bacterium]|nr:ribonuclease H-like domain-containing protein [Bacteroidales bacterium]